MLHSFLNLNKENIMSENSSSSSGGISLFGVLGIVFVVLKLCDVIDWSWWLVLLPFYGVATIIIGVLLISILIESIFK